MTKTALNLGGKMTKTALNLDGKMTKNCLFDVVISKK